ncbi:MAG: hypothetical protein U1E72_03585 [Burkholderiaceae bacterium]
MPVAGAWPCGARALLDKGARGPATCPTPSRRATYRNQWAGLADRATVADALDLLAAHGWLAEAAIATGADGGRPTTTYSLTEGARRVWLARLAALDDAGDKENFASPFPSHFAETGQNPVLLLLAGGRRGSAEISVVREAPAALPHPLCWGLG